MIAHGVAGEQIKNAGVLSGLQTERIGPVSEDFAQIFQQKTLISFPAIPGASVAEGAASAGSDLPVKEELERGVHPSTAESVVESRWDARAIRPKLSNVPITAGPKVLEEAPQKLAAATGNAETLNTGAEGLKHPPSSVKASLPTPTETLPIQVTTDVREPTEGVAPLSSPRYPNQQVTPTSAATKAERTTASGRKQISDKAHAPSYTTQGAAQAPQIAPESVNIASDKPVQPSTVAAVVEQIRLATLNEAASAQEDPGPPTKGPAPLQSAPAVSKVASPAPVPSTDPLAKGAHESSPVVSTADEVKSPVRILTTGPRHPFDVQVTNAVPVVVLASGAASVHPAVAAAFADPLMSDRGVTNPGSAKGMNMMPPLEGELRPHGVALVENAVEPAISVSVPGIAHATLSATPTTLEVGVVNSSHGWLKVRAELAGNGDVNASLTGGSPAAAERLRGDLPSLNLYLQGERVQVGTISVHAAASEMPASLQESPSGLTSFDRSSSDPTFSMTGGLGEGRHGDQPQQPGGEAFSERGSEALENQGAGSLASEPRHDAGLSEVERSRGLGGSKGLPPVGYGAGGGWLNVRA